MVVGELDGAGLVHLLDAVQSGPGAVKLRRQLRLPLVVQRFRVSVTAEFRLFRVEQIGHILFDVEVLREGFLLRREVAQKLFVRRKLGQFCL